jgi:two-component system, NarL family, sensor histidine kinase BarA
MSYRSFKRVLGETSLERKCRILFGGCLFFLIAGSFWWYGSRTEDVVYDNTRNTGKLLIDTAMVSLHFVKVDDHSVPLETRLSHREYSDYAARDFVTSRKYSAWVLRPGATEKYRTVVKNAEENAPQQLSPFEAQVLDYFSRQPQPDPKNQDAKPEYVEQRLADQQEYRYFQPIRLRESCIGCHTENLVTSSLGLPSSNPPQPGDLKAVVEIVLPDAETQSALNWNRAILISTAIVTFFVAMIAAYVIVRYVIVKPLKHLRDVSDEVSRGNVEARADIHTADEFEELGDAFNRMLRNLVTIQEELRGVNSNLDLKVDELAQANMRLYELNRLKSDFLATMSHELRTPLNSIIGFSDVLGSINSLDDKQKRYVQNIQKSGRVLLDMINDILDLAKIESGKMELRLADFRIDDAISAQCDMARPLTEKKNIDLEIDVEPNLPELFQDQGKVQQVLNNLLSNAIKFTPEGGRIVVSARHELRGDREELLLSIADTGVGIAEEDQVAIFEKFRQGKTALAGGDAMTREYSGTGLGLSIVKELCKLLGGEVSLKSELGKGSTFVVRLPWVRADQPRVDSPLNENIDELIRPRRQELQRSLDRPVPAAPE